VNVDDVASAIVAALEKGMGTYVLAGEPLTQKEAFDIAAKELGVEPPKKKVPLPLALLAARIASVVARMRGKKPLMTTEHVGVLGYDRIFDCAKARRELGFSPRPLAQGIIEMAAEYKKSRA
jgi:dihydroflavonol-4-reductase